MKKNLFPFFLLVLVVGCATDFKARKTAAVTLQMLAENQAQLDLKMAAEKQFYSSQLAQMQQALGPGSNLNSTGDLTRTWIYGYVATHTLKDAQSAAGEIIAQPESLSLAIITDYLGKGIDDEIAAIVALKQKQDSLQAALQTNLKSLQISQDRMDQIRSCLGKLKEKPSLQDDFTTAQAYGQAILDAFKNNADQKP